MTDVSANASAAQWWFRGAGTEKTFGPVSREVLLSWAREGRIFPEDKVSPDQSVWGDARMLGFLAMDTVIVRPDGRVLGPFNAAAIDALRKAGKVPENSVVKSSAELLAPAAATSAAARGEIEGRDARIAELEAALAAARKAPAEELRSLREAVRAAKEDAADARGEIARERAAREEAERAAEEVRKASEGAVERALEAEGAERESVLARAAEADAAAASAREELEALKVARAEAERALAAAKAEAQAARDEADSEHRDLAEARARISAERSAHEKAEAALSAEKAAREEAETALSAEKGAREEAEAALSAEKGAREEAEAALSVEKTAREEAEAALSAEKAARAAEAVPPVTVHADLAAAAAVEAELASVRSELETLRRENAELLEFSNARDGESRQTIEALREQVRSLSESKPGGAAAPEGADAGEEEPVGDARRVQALQDRVTDLTRERGELADKLADAQAALAVATRPLDGDAAMVRRFADEALDYLRASFEEEKRRNEAERTASVARQREYHDRIEQLERALRRDPGEKSRSQMQEERAERELAQLRQELDSERERHKADLDRAAHHEKALEGRVSAMQQRESAVREQLRRVEKRTADYDSLSSQLRRREEEVLESARQFAEAREQWQVVERMLKRRIDELEHGAGALFEDAPSADPRRQDAATEGGDPSKLVLPSWIHNLK